jgi:cell pole-organizing protein PopZ
MGQAGAQREPSMEEILASIRRIIENNDPADPAPVDHNDSYDEPAVQKVPKDRPGDDAGPQDTRDSYGEDDDAPEAYESDPAVMELPEHAGPAVAPAISLADVAARVRSTPEASMTEHAPERSAAPQVAATIPAPVNDDLASRIDDDVAEELRQALVSDEPVDAGARDVARPGQHDAPDAAAASKAPKENVSTHHHDAGVGSSQSGPGQSGQAQGGQLVSLHTGEKVAAAFGELSAAIAAGQTRSFDEIAEEMLKPMLTQWLDDNLPTLVERLVREEIERVSRGNRA